MGSLDVKSDERLSVLEPELEIASSESESTLDSPTISEKNDVVELKSETASASESDANELIQHSSNAFSEDNASDPDKNIYPLASCPSSMSSTDSMIEDPFRDSDSEHGEKAPPIQVMERPTTRKYRIPSSVFARNKSIDSDWGMASNDSLFSIHMGGMSFRNQDSMVWNSGELDLGFEEEPSASSNIINSPHDNQHLGGKPVEVLDERESDVSDKNHELGDAGKSNELDEIGKTHELDEESKSEKLGEKDKIYDSGEISNDHESGLEYEPIKPDALDNREDQESKSHLSAGSESTKSFAFPILTADRDGGPSAKAIPEPQLDTQAEAESEPEKQPQPSEAKADPPVATWTNCFGCCTFCS